MARTIVGDIPEVKDSINTNRSIKEIMDEFLENFANARRYKGSADDALSLVMEFDVGVESALLDLEIKNTRGVISFDDIGWLKAFKNKLSKLLLAKLIIEASGLFFYEEKLIDKLIDQMFVNTQTKPEKP